MHVKEVYNLYEWLPSHGESGVSFHTDNSNVHIMITYEYTVGEKVILMRRSIIFHHAVDFILTIFPGARTPSESINLDGAMLGSMIEIVGSKFSEEFNAHFNNLFTFKHFLLHFLSENKRIEIIAENFSVREPHFLEEI